MTTVAEHVVEALRLLDINTLFCLPGKQNDDFFDALVDAPDIRPIVTRHEQGAGYMALGAAQATGRPSAFCVVPGPGMLNAGAALTSAYWSNARVLAIVGQIPSETQGRGWGVLHELEDQTAVLRQVTKHTEAVNDAATAVSQIDAAISALVSGRPRPVSIEIAADVWRKEAPGSLRPPERRTPTIDQNVMDQAVGLITAAERPLIVVGGGAQDAPDEVRVLAHRMAAPVTTRRMGHGVVPTSDAHFVPLPVGRDLWANADVVVAVGTRLEFPLLHWGHDENLSLIKIDIDDAELDRHGATTIAVRADAATACAALADAITPVEDAAILADLTDRRSTLFRELTYLQPQLDYLAAIRDALPDDGIVVEDVTQLAFAAHLAFDFRQPRTLLSSGPAGTLGAAFPTSLGAKVAMPDREIVTISGDGGFLFGATELASAVQHGIATTTIVFNDGAYGNVRRIQRQVYGDDRTIASMLHNPDFVAFAHSFGAVGVRVEDPDELRRALRASIESDQPTIIDVQVDEMPDPWPYLRMGRVRGAPR